jgi:hypothetical protein
MRSHETPSWPNLGPILGRLHIDKHPIGPLEPNWEAGWRRYYMELY